MQSPQGPPRSNRWLWPALMLAVLVILLLHDYSGAIGRLADADRAAASALDRVAVGTLLTDFTNRFDACNYRLLVFCEPKTFEARATEPPAVPSSSLAALVAGAIVAIPKLPDATLYVLRLRYRQGPVAFGMMLIFIALNVLVFIGVIGESKNPMQWALTFAFAPLVIAGVFWLIKAALVHVVLSAALLFLQALLIVGGIPAALAGVLKIFHDARELRATTREAARAAKGE